VFLVKTVIEAKTAFLEKTESLAIKANKDQMEKMALLEKVELKVNREKKETLVREVMLVLMEKVV